MIFAHLAGHPGRRFVHGGFGRHRHGPDWHEGRHAHGRAGRVFDYGELRLVLLALIAEQPRHGYELIKAIEEKVGGDYSPSPGVIYPTLAQLEDLGHATVEAAEGGRKRYAVTEAGRAHLGANAATLHAAFARMTAAGAARADADAPQILRARQNLKLALHLRLARGPLTPAARDAIAAALDAAAAAIEKA
jgi:DNA-binding PadR family transcriptional regulator